MSIDVADLTLFEMNELMVTKGKCAALGPEWTNVFFPVGAKEGWREINTARQICGSCPVENICRTWARATGQEYGTWGGETEWERAEWRKARKVVAA
jgi:WhiB family transcriptional regulator, redox-sensing transcriptional regulator